MKKILLATSALVGAVAFAGAASAAAPKVTVGGTSNFQLGVVSEDLDANKNSQAFRSDNTISFKVDGKTDAGLGYGGEIILEADVTDNADTAGTNAERTFLYLEGDSWGRFEMGSTLAPTSTMKVGAESIARGTGGIDGDWTYFTSVGSSGGANTRSYIATPDLLLDYGTGALGDESLENLNKVVYYSPRYAGFQLGFAYVPNMDYSNNSRGQNVARLFTAGTANNIYVGGLNYTGTMDGFSLAASLTGEYGDGSTTATQDLASWAAGAKVGYQGFSVAGSYGDWGKSLRQQGATNYNNDTADYWTLGGAYETGPFGVSVTYLDSRLAATASTENKFSNVVVGTDYKLAPGLTPYAEVSFFDQNSVTNANDNQGTLFLLGTQLNF